MMKDCARAGVLAAVLLVAPAELLGQASIGAAATPPRGYYRHPALAGEWLIFAAEGDLWRTPLSGGAARRLTSHPGEERNPVISPDGQTLAFVGQYEGAAEVYTMPLAGGLPVRRTFSGGRSVPVAWSGGADSATPPQLVIATQRHSTLPSTQLVRVDLATGAATLFPLAQASDAAFGVDGAMYFTRLDFQGSHTRRYSGGTAQQLWRLDAAPPGGEHREATPLTADYDGTSASPMMHDGRLFFRTDRSGVMNIWSMALDGKDLRQHTRHDDYEVKTPSLGVSGASRGRIAYQHGADIHVLDIANGTSSVVDITLETDLDQMRERWVGKPLDLLTAAHLSPDGQHVALTARGRVFVAPRKTGRLVEAARTDGVRYRDGRFLPAAPTSDGPPPVATLLALSDQSGEVELWTMPANGVGDATQFSTDGEVLRWEAIPSPDGKRIAHHDKNNRLWIFDVATKANTRIDQSELDNFMHLTWSPDGRYLAYVAWCPNMQTQIKLYDAQSGTITPLTTDRTISMNPAWDPKGDWLYFLSDRNLQTVVGSPWGFLQPEPFFDKRTKVYALALRPGLRSPFEEADELHLAKADEKKEGDDSAKKDGAASDDAEAKKKEGEKPAAPKPIDIDLAGIADRVVPVPVPPGNYGSLSVNDKAMFFTASDAAVDAKSRLQAFSLEADAIKKREWKVETIAGEVKGYELSQDGKSLLIQTENALAIIDASASKPEDLAKSNIDLSGWKLSVQPREEWRQMYAEAWRLHRDYFYDPAMHGVDWKAMRAKYAPLVDRVACRGDLNDVLAQLIAELSALHHFVIGGDVRSGPDDIAVATLGADLVRDEPAGGWRIRSIYASDPDHPELASPLVRPGAALDIREGDVITLIDGRSTLSAPDVSALLRSKAGRQVLIHTRRDGGEPRASVVFPVSMSVDRELRYRQWQLRCRDTVEELGKGELGYVHLQAMGSEDMADFTRQYYPIFNRKGLIIDVRNNGGGNIDSWILARLMRKAWFFWQPRIGQSFWNMQYAFRGHMVVLCNESTGSDGEAFAEGFRRLGLGKVMGRRTWGGEIWLSFSNYLVDKGIASAAEIGVYGPEGTWLIEGRGVEPDIEVDNLPVATFRGEDAQLRAAIEHLQQRIKEEPVETPPMPNRPDKSWKPQ